MASGRMNTVEEGLLKIAQDLVALQAAPDCTPDDMQFLVQKQTEFLERARRGIDGANPNAPLPGVAPGGAQPPQGPPPELAALLGGGGGIPSAGAPPMPGRGPMPAAPRPGPTDMGEIARMLG